jgi:hypothetical protein
MKRKSKQSQKPRRRKLPVGSEAETSDDDSDYKPSPKRTRSRSTGDTMSPKGDVLSPKRVGAAAKPSKSKSRIEGRIGRRPRKNPAARARVTRKAAAEHRMNNPELFDD